VRYQVLGSWPPEYVWFPYFSLSVAVPCYTAVDTWPGDSMMWREKFYGVNGPCSIRTYFYSAGYRVWGVRDPGGVPPKYIYLHVNDSLIAPGWPSMTFPWSGDYISSEVYGGKQYDFGHIKFTIVMSGNGWTHAIPNIGYSGGGSFPGYDAGRTGAGRVDVDFSVGAVEATPSQLLVSAQIKDVEIIYYP